MPGLVVHTLLAASVLERWRQAPGSAFVDPHDPRIVGAFFRGAMAPDMGYYPGGVRRVSDLVHRIRSADLARALVRFARAETDRAYAWGWLSHVLGDIALHPAINRTSGEAVDGVAGRELAPDEDPATHLRVELGLDAHFHAHHQAFLHSVWNAPSAAPSHTFIARAFRSIHGTSVSYEDLARSDLALARFLPLMLRYTGMIAAGGRLAREQPWMSRLLRLPAEPRPLRRPAPPFEAFLSPLAPTATLLRSSLKILRTFSDTFQEQVVTGIAGLENHDLDTGIPQPESWPHGDLETLAREAA